MDQYYQLAFDPEVHEGLRLALGYLWERVSLVSVLYGAAGISICLCVPLVYLVVSKLWEECGLCGLCGVMIVTMVALYQRALLIYMVVNYPICYFIVLDCFIVPFLLWCLEDICSPLQYIEKYYYFARGWVFTFLALIMLCLNILLLDLHSYCLHYETIDVTLWSLYAKLFFLLTNYSYVILVLLSISLFMLAFLSLLATMFSNYVTKFRHSYNDKRQSRLLISILCTWCGSNLIVALVPGYLDVDVFISCEIFLRRYFLLGPTLMLVSVPLSYCCGFQFCWYHSRLKDAPTPYGLLRRDRHEQAPTPCGLLFLFLILLLFTVVFTVLVHGPTTPHCHEEDKSLFFSQKHPVCASPSGVDLDPSAPESSLPSTLLPPTSPPELTTVSPSQATSATKKCLNIDRDSKDSIKMSYLSVLHYLDREDKEHTLKIIKRIAADWEELALILGSDPKLIVSSYSGGKDIALRCCRDVLSEWFENNGADSYPLSWNGLIKVIRDMELIRVAAEIETALQCVITD